MSDQIRCFICIDLPRNIIKEAEIIQEVIKKKNLIVGSFVDGENLHLTLKFLGEIELKKLEEVKERLKTIKFKKFISYLGELGVFSQEIIRIVWIHVLGKQILDLQLEIDKKLEGLFEREERFMSHLTIARVKKVKDKKIFLEELKKVNVRNLSFPVNEFYLMKSELKPGGSVYTIIEEIKLN